MAGSTYAADGAPTSDIQLIDIENSLGQTSRVVMIDREAYQDYRLINPAPDAVSEFFNHQNYDFRDHVKTSLLDNNFPEHIADIMAHRFARSYHPSTGYQPDNDKPIYEAERPFYDIFQQSRHSFGPSAQSYTASGENTKLNEEPAVSAFCSIAQTTSSVMGNEWATAMVGNSTKGLSIQPDREYGADFSTFIKLHEEAHCMGADEPQADYVATKLYLKQHADTEHATSFIPLFKSLRSTYSLVHGSSGLYHGTSHAMEAALAEFEAGIVDTQTIPEIWSQAVERNDFEKTTIGDLANYVQSHFQSAIEAGDFKTIAHHMVEITSDQLSDINTDILANMRTDLDYIGRISAPNGP